MSEVVNCAAYADGRRVAEVALPEISEVLKQDADRFIWIGLNEPDGSLLRRVQEEFGLHDLAIEDALVAHQRPKLERYDDSLFIVLRTARRDVEARRLELGETHIFVGARYVVSVRHGSAVSYTAVRTRAEATPALLAQGPGFVLYALMDFIVDQYFPVVHALEDELEELEDDIFAETFDRETTSRMKVSSDSALRDRCAALEHLYVRTPADVRPETMRAPQRPQWAIPDSK